MGPLPAANPNQLISSAQLHLVEFRGKNVTEAGFGGFWLDGIGAVEKSALKRR